MALTFKHAQLPNGLDVVAEVNPDAHSFAAGLFVKTGSRDESPEVNGVSHFLEHMAFKGTDTIGTTDYAAEQAALEKVEQAYRAYDLERRRTSGRNDARIAELEQRVDTTMTDFIRSRVAPEALERIEAHRAAGHTTILITGAVSVLTRPLREYFDVILAAELGVGVRTLQRRRQRTERELAKAS